MYYNILHSRTGKSEALSSELQCERTSKTKLMAFTEINPVTGQVWTREQLWSAYQTEAATVTEYQFEAAKDSRLISWPSQWQNLKARWEIHLKEWSAATADVHQLGRTFRGHLEELREVVTAPVLNK